MLTRRRVLKGLALTLAGTVGFGGLAVAEPFFTMITRYRITPPGWPRGLRLRLAVIADVHACEHWMPAERIRQIVQRTNALGADAVLLLGDYVVGGKLAMFGGRPIPHSVWAEVLAELRAPLGVHAVLGNHDWWEDIEIQRRRAGPVKSRIALEAAGIAVYENDAVRLEKDGQPFWIAGLGDQWAFWPGRRATQKSPGYIGVHDLPGTLAKVTDDAPVVLMVHEPDIFPQVPARVALTLAGHTHGGQIRIAGYAPSVPSTYGQRYVYGHIVEDRRHLIVSGGVGLSVLPVRFGSPPEIVVVDLGGGAAAA